MNVLRHSDPDFAAQLDALAAASSLFDLFIEEPTRATMELTLLHLGAHLRRLVLAPLAEIAADMVLPGI
jgi:7,8-dihydro-6-hydroxymethylpterin-pyrophosphokinase